MMRICSLASSSSGNCIYVGDDETNILIDIGISKKRVEEGLKKIQVEASKVDAILITHEHSDHIKGLGVFARKYKVPIYTTKKTWKNVLLDKSLGVIDLNLFNEISPDESFFIKGIEVHPFSTSHDAVDPVCYTFNKENQKISVATDLGCYDSYIKEKLKGSDILFLEANHDVRMLEVGSYPYFLKRRILSDVGHLSNETSGRLIRELIDGRLSHVILGHLSKENNVAELAYEAVKMELACMQSDIINNLTISVAEREENSELIVLP